MNKAGLTAGDNSGAGGDSGNAIEPVGGNLARTLGTGGTGGTGTTPGVNGADGTVVTI